MPVYCVVTVYIGIKILYMHFVLDQQFDFHKKSFIYKIVFLFY